MAKSKASGHRPGGGIASRVNVEKPVRTGKGARAIIPAGAAQQGQRQRNHITERGQPTSYGGVQLYSRGPGYNKSQYGNEIALNVGKGGPGAGYKQYGQAGSQGCYGKPDKGNPMPTAKPLFPGWEK
jgi:hypothetical protein